MSDNELAISAYFQEFLSQANLVVNRPRDPFVNRLYFAQAITLMEKYLSDVLIAEIRSNPCALKRLANTPKFHGQCLPIPKALNTSISEFIVHAMQNEVWHRVNDVKVFYRAALGVDFHVPITLRNAIDKRHHIAHRNGTDLDGNAVVVADEEIVTLYSELTRFLRDIDRKYLRNKDN
jgi:hypothetical protein